MKWKTKPFITYDVGDIRERVKFSLKPRECVDGTTRWLEKVAVKEKLFFNWKKYGYYWKEIECRPID